MHPGTTTGNGTIRCRTVVRLPCFFFLFSCFLVSTRVSAQKDTAILADSLGRVTVHAFSINRSWEQAPASVALITAKGMERSSPVSLVPMFNSLPGVRMEERSPGSYRLSIRGSTLRSPFGVRNVKIYWNDIPLTDGGGNTYLQVVDAGQIGGAEVVRGPAASMYGAGTGGAVLLNSTVPFSMPPADQLHAQMSGGSYGLFDEQSGWRHQAKAFSMDLEQTHLQADGYRQQSALRKDVVKWDGSAQFANQELHFLAFYTDMYYQTPGGITKLQLQEDPTLARLPGGGLPGSIQARAAIYNKTLFGGASHVLRFSDRLSLESSLVIDHTSFQNPFITDYESRDETNEGLRTQFIYRKPGSVSIQANLGAEWLGNHSLIDDYGNVNGSPDTVQFKDNLYADQWFAFGQFHLETKRFTAEAGLSMNNQALSYRRLTDPQYTGFVHTSIDAVLTPRFSVSWRTGHTTLLYVVAAEGFSPPTIAEVHPADKLFHGELQPEHGWNYELGWKGGFWAHRLVFDVAAYYFQLNDAIVQRNNSLGQAFFVNAGGATEKGCEAWAEWHFLSRPAHGFQVLNVWSSYSFQPYYFSSYRQGTADYSGNAVTGVPRNTWVSGFDAETITGWYLHLVYNATSPVPVTDANDEYAAAYHLLQARLGVKWISAGLHWQLFGGVDNALDENYSLGNDINAAGRRFYNAAPRRNFYAGISLGWK